MLLWSLPPQEALSFLNNLNHYVRIFFLIQITVSRLDAGVKYLPVSPSRKVSLNKL
jgi:hypothetical protein